MDGRVAGFLDVTSSERIATYDGRAISRLTDAPSGAEEQLIDQLRSLGYLE